MDPFMKSILRRSPSLRNAMTNLTSCATASGLNAPIPAMAVGTVVEEEVLEHETKPAYEGGSRCASIWIFEVPVQWSRVIAEAPAGCRLRYTLNKLPETALTKTTEAVSLDWFWSMVHLLVVEEIPAATAFERRAIPRHLTLYWRKLAAFAERYSAPWTPRSKERI